MSNSNGNGAARPVERSAKRRKRTKSQRAAICAEILAGRRGYRLNRRELAEIFGISTVMIDIARKLSPAARQRVVNGEGRVGHFAPATNGARASRTDAIVAIAP